MSARRRSAKEILWDSLEDTIVSRRWDALRNAWVATIPTIDPAGAIPDPTLSEVLQSTGNFDEILAPNALTIIKGFRGEVPEVVFREGLHWLHKAVHVLGASEIHIAEGMPSWSLTAAYQSAFFAVRAIMAFAGFAIAEIQEVSVVVDLSRDTRGLRPGRLDELGAFEEEISFCSLGTLFRHKQIWLLFQRLLRMLTRAPWPDGWANFFSNLDIGDLTYQRHSLHYQLDYWVVDDMYRFVQREEFRDIQPTGNGRQMFAVDRVNFTLAVGFTATRMALFLFNSLVSATNRLSADQVLLDEVVTIERHPLFAELLRVPMAA